MRCWSNPGEAGLGCHRVLDTLTRAASGFGILRNLGVGLVGALVGGLVFRLFGIFPGLDKIAISLRDIVAALIGSLLVLALIWLWQRLQKSG